MKPLAVFLFALLAAMSSFAQSAPTTPADAYKTYRDNDAKLTLSYPPDMEVQETTNTLAAVKQQTPDKLKAATDCVVIPFTAVRRSASNLAMYMEFREETGCLGATVNEDFLSSFITSALSSSLAQMGNPNVADDLTKTTLGGHLAYSQSGKVVFKLNPQMTFYVTMVCIATDSHVLCMQLTSSTESGLQTMRQLPIQFDGQPLQPIAPPKP